MYRVFYVFKILWYCIFLLYCKYALQLTVLAALLASVSGDAPLSTSYGPPSHSDSYSPSYGGHGGHETVKRHTGGQDCNCRGVSGGRSYNGGSVHPQPTKPNYNDIMASPQPPPTYNYAQPSYSPSPPAQQPQHPAPAAQPQPSYTYAQPSHSPSPPAPQPQHPAPAAQPQPSYTPPVYSAPSPPAPVASPQPQPAPASVTYAQPVYSPPTPVQNQVQTQPTKPNYNAIQAPTSVPAQPPAPSPLYSGGGQPVYSGGRPNYNAYPPQGYAGWGLSVSPLFPQSMAFRRDNAKYVNCSVVYDRVPPFINCFLHQVFT